MMAVSSTGPGPGSSPAPAQQRPVLLQLVVFASVGGALNIVYIAIYAAARTFWSSQTSNVVALVLSTIVGTWSHRRVTFGVRGTARTVSHQSLGILLLLLGLAVTAGSLWLLEQSVDEPTRTAELLVLAAANIAVGLVRFATFRTVMVPVAAGADRG